jgi:feruloyl esterase
MPRRLIVTMAALSLASIASVRSQAPSPPDAARCQALTALRLPDVRVSSAEHVDANAAAAGQVHAAHCHVSGTIGTEIGFGLWLPDGWNGRFLMTGGGGFVGAVPPPGNGVDQGFAVTSTDTGHQSTGTDARWALDNLERQLNFGYLGTHRTEETARAIVRQYYGTDPHHSYFNGCSTGGRQALMEAQRFPNDFDGIVSGAPVYNWTQALARRSRTCRPRFRIPRPCKRPSSPSPISRSCRRPRSTPATRRTAWRTGSSTIRVPVTSICAPSSAAKARAAADCLTDAQSAAIARVYAPLRDANGLVYEGQPVAGKRTPAAGHVVTGLQSAHRGFRQESEPLLGVRHAVLQVLRVRGSELDVSRLTTSLRTGIATRGELASFLDADTPDLSAFRARKGKLLLWHGWADPALNPLATDPLLRFASSPGILRAAGTSGCSCCPACCTARGGAGPDQVDRLAAMVDWVEKGQAPARLVATGAPDGGLRTRPLCAYPGAPSTRGRVPRTTPRTSTASAERRYLIGNRSLSVSRGAQVGFDLLHHRGCAAATFAPRYSRPCRS